MYMYIYIHVYMYIYIYIYIYIRHLAALCTAPHCSMHYMPQLIEDGILSQRHNIAVRMGDKKGNPLRHASPVLQSHLSASWSGLQEMLPFSFCFLLLSRCPRIL